MRIYAACRDKIKADKNIEELSSISDAHPSNEIISTVIDLADDISIEKAAQSIPQLDILVNNAGIYIEQDFSSAQTIRQSLQDTYSTNVFGTIALSTTFLPILQESANSSKTDSHSAKRKRSTLINVSTGLSSFSNATTPTSPQYHSNEVIYASSKAALNYYTVWAAKKYPDIRIVAVAPGHTATALNQFKGRQTVETGAQFITDAILDLNGPSGVFLEKGKEHAW